MPPGKYILKLCLLGDGAVGKTSLVRRYVFDVFDDKYLMSFGTKVSKKSVVVDDMQADLMIWDILGQRTQNTLHAAYYRGAAGALVVCDVTREETVKSLSSWIDNFVSVVGEMPILLLANKCDLKGEVSMNELKSFSDSIGSTLLETSAKTGDNVEDAFSLIAQKMVEGSG